MLEIRDVWKTFSSGSPNAVPALQNVSLHIEPGSFVVVIGTNGSGKTTLLSAVAGSFFVDRGSIKIIGNDVTRWPEFRRARYLGRVFQNPFSGTAPNMSIAENLALAQRRGQPRSLRWTVRHVKRRELRDQLRRLGMGLEDRLDHPVGSLSGGQRQALTLLMATCVRPEVLLLDEHTAALDPKSADQVIALTDRIVREEKLTTLMVTHSMHQATNLGDRLVMMNRGRVLHDFRGAERRRLRVDDLLGRFEEVRRSEMLDESAAELLARVYI